MNEKYLFKKWIPIIIVVIILLVALPISLARGNYSIVFGVTIALILVFYNRKTASNNIATALKQKTSEKLIECLVKPLHTLKDRDMRESFVAYNTALSHILYGEYENAEKAMEKVNWDNKIPMYQALDLNIRSFIKYFHTNDYLEALSLVRKAKALASVSSAYPGSKKSEMAYEAYVEIGQILVGVINEEIVTRLEMKFDNFPLIPKLFTAWGLSVAYKKRGQEDRLEKMDKFIKHNAPFCKALSYTGFSGL